MLPASLHFILIFSLFFFSFLCVHPPPTLLSSSFVVQNSASVRRKIDRACWIFNKRCCPAGLPQPSGLISTANTVGQRLTPNRVAQWSQAAPFLTVLIVLVVAIPSHVARQPQDSNVAPPNAALHCSDCAQPPCGTEPRGEAAALTWCSLMASWFSAWTESCCAAQSRGDVILLWWSVQRRNSLAGGYLAHSVHIRVERNCVSWSPGGGY